MGPNFFCWLTLIAVLLSGRYSLGQESFLVLKNLSTENGLTASTYNQYISEDSRRNIWISSINGLNRFDGLVNLQYLANDSVEYKLADPIIQSQMFEDKEENLWFNTSTAIHKFSLSENVFKQVEINYSGNVFKDFQLIDLDTSLNLLYFLGEWGVLGEFYPLFAREIKNSDNLVLMDSIPAYSFRGLRKVERQGKMGLSLFIPLKNGWQIRTYKNRELIHISSFNQGNDNTWQPYSTFSGNHLIWIGLGSGLVGLDRSGRVLGIFNKLAGKKISKVTGIGYFNNSQLIVGTENDGLLLFDIENRKFIGSLKVRIESRIQNFPYPITGITNGREGTLWISTQTNGVFYGNINRIRFQIDLVKGENISYERNFKSISVDSIGNVWGIAADRVIYNDIRSGGSKEKILAGVPGNEKTKINLYSIDHDSEGNNWLGTNKGLFLIEEESINLYKIKSKAEKLSDGVFIKVVELSNGKRFALTFGYGLLEILRLNGEYILSNIVNPTSGSISAICERYNGQILTAQWRHEIQLYQDAVGSLTLKDAIPFSPLVYAMAESPDSSKIWIASAQGLYWINTLTDKFSIHKDTIFSSRFLAANGLVFDDDNKMWVSTNKGLVQYSPEKAENADPDGPPPNVFRVFTVADGLPSNEFNFWSFTKTRNGELAFGTTNGYILFNPKDITEYPVEAKPTITQILVNNQEVKGREKFGKATYQGEEIEELILKPAERTFTFRFSAMDYGDPQATQFEYRLRKKNGDLINKGNERFVRYFNLEQGEYVFELYASNSENVWNETPRRLALRLKPYFYETPWFYALLAAVGLGIIYGIYRNRTEHLRKKQQLAELENAILRIQMNPHFIFNSLSSIQAYMLDKDTKVANKYLIHLSRLMRKILDIAEKPQISVGEDIELLTEYMEAEKLRFEQAFSYKIEKVGDMDEDEVMIPTMILQPFVENAIIHGFKKNSKEGVLTVRYRKDLKYLICEVRDNGIGRQASTREKKKGHNSKATVITNRRLALIQEKMGQPASLEILDLFDQNENPSGTKVEIRLPLF